MAGIYGAERGKNYVKQELLDLQSGSLSLLLKTKLGNTLGEMPRGYAKKYWESAVNSPRAYTEIRDSLDPSGELISLDVQGTLVETLEGLS